MADFVRGRIAVIVDRERTAGLDIGIGIEGREPRCILCMRHAGQVEAECRVRAAGASIAGSLSTRI